MSEILWALRSKAWRRPRLSFFRDPETNEAHVGFLRGARVETFCGIKLVMRRAGGYRPRHHSAPIFERRDDGFDVDTYPDISLCARCFDGPADAAEVTDAADFL